MKIKMKLLSRYQSQIERKSFRLEARKSYNFDRNPKRAGLFQKLIEQNCFKNCAKVRIDQKCLTFWPLTSILFVQSDFTHQRIFYYINLHDSVFRVFFVSRFKFTFTRFYY